MAKYKGIKGAALNEYRIHVWKADTRLQPVEYIFVDVRAFNKGSAVRETFWRKGLVYAETVMVEKRGEMVGEWWFGVRTLKRRVFVEQQIRGRN